MAAHARIAASVKNMLCTRLADRSSRLNLNQTWPQRHRDTKARATRFVGLPCRPTRRTVVRASATPFRLSTLAECLKRVCEITFDVFLSVALYLCGLIS